MKIRTREQQIVVDFWSGVKMTNKNKPEGVHPEGWRVEKHIPYIPDYNDDHTMNLYYPKDFECTGEDGKKLPTIINIHGGGWMYGTVDDSEDYMAYLASRGFAVMGMGYQLVPRVDVRTIIQEIYCSLHWLSNFGGKRGFDLSRVMLTGDSAGAHLALLVGCIQASPDLQAIYGVTPVSFPIATIGVSCPCQETNELYVLPASTPDESQRLAMSYKELLLGEMGIMAPNSRALSFTEASWFVQDPTLFPSVFLIGSENESLYFQSQKLLQQLQDKGLFFDSMVWKREDGQHLMHVFNVEHWEWCESRISNDRMLEFFRSCCIQ